MNDPRPLLSLVSELRGLKQKRDTPVLFHDDQSFLQMLADAQKLSRHTDSAFDSAALTLALSTLSPLEWGEADASLGDLSVLGFYDRTARAVVMKRSAAFQKREDGEIVDESAWTLAHEAVHALQEQNFGLPHFDHLFSEDRRLATRAVYEGDAMLGMLAYVEHESFGSLYRKVVEFERQGDAAAEERYRRATGSGSDFDKRPLIQRERVIAPYRDGLRFVGAIYRSGGMQAVNKIYAALPQTTEQVLHVEKYLAGELGAQFAPLEAPEGHRVVQSTSVGELLMRASLDQCMAEGTAHQAAAGWNGDQILLTRDLHTHTLLWNTAWDTEADAEQFELAALQMLKCWSRRDRLAKEDALFSGENAVVRKGSRVAVVYGFSAKPVEPPKPSEEPTAETPPESPGLPKPAAQVAALPEPSAAAEPATPEELAKTAELTNPAVPAESPEAAAPAVVALGPPAELLATAMLEREITPASMETKLAALPYKELQPLKIVRPPYVAGGNYINEGWNLKIPVPQGVTPKTKDGRLVLENPEFGFRVVAFQSDLYVTEKTKALVHEAHREILLKKARKIWPRDEERSTPLGNASHRLWVAGREQASASVGRMLIIPICEGTGSIILASEWTTPQGKAASEHVFTNLKAYAAGVPPICAKLNPLAP